jgi:hypothetical protein
MIYTGCTLYSTFACIRRVQHRVAVKCENRLHGDIHGCTHHDGTDGIPSGACTAVYAQCKLCKRFSYGIYAVFYTAVHGDA